jgi:hypothetical protein
MHTQAKQGNIYWRDIFRLRKERYSAGGSIYRPRKEIDTGIRHT